MKNFYEYHFSYPSCALGYVSSPCVLKEDTLEAIANNLADELLDKDDNENLGYCPTWQLYEVQPVEGEHRKKWNFTLIP